MLLDSNIVIYGAEPDDVLLNRYLHNIDACISSISRIEVLGFPRFYSLGQEHQFRLTESVGLLLELAIEEPIVVRAIALRRNRSMSLGDSIIAATALEYELPLVTRNSRDFKHIPQLRIIDPFNPTA